MNFSHLRVDAYMQHHAVAIKIDILNMLHICNTMHLYL